ncbi:hypothetical protein [Klebsiella oxytoca]
MNIQVKSGLYLTTLKCITFCFLRLLSTRSIKRNIRMTLPS